MTEMRSTMRVFRAGGRHDEEEFFAADPAETIVAADILMNAVGEIAQHRIAGVVAEPVVDEIVDVEDDEATVAAMPGGRPAYLRPTHGEAAVGAVDLETGDVAGDAEHPGVLLNRLAHPQPAAVAAIRLEGA